MGEQETLPAVHLQAPAVVGQAEVEEPFLPAQGLPMPGMEPAVATATLVVRGGKETTRRRRPGHPSGIAVPWKSLVAPAAARGRGLRPRRAAAVLRGRESGRVAASETAGLPFLTPANGRERAAREVASRRMVRATTPVGASGSVGVRETPSLDRPRAQDTETTPLASAAAAILRRACRSCVLTAEEGEGGAYAVGETGQVPSAPPVRLPAVAVRGSGLRRAVPLIDAAASKPVLTPGRRPRVATCAGVPPRQMGRLVTAFAAVNFGAGCELKSLSVTDEWAFGQRKGAAALGVTTNSYTRTCRFRSGGYSTSSCRSSDGSRCAVFGSYVSNSCRSRCTRTARTTYTCRWTRSGQRSYGSGSSGRGSDGGSRQSGGTSGTDYGWDTGWSASSDSGIPGSGFVTATRYR